MKENEKYLELMLLSIDNEISTTQLQELNNYLAAHPDAVLEYESLRATVVQLDEIEYPYKNELLQITSQPRFKLFFNQNILKLAAVLIPLFAIALYILQPNRSNEVVKNENIKNEPSQTTINIQQETPLTEDKVSNNSIISNRSPKAVEKFVSHNKIKNIPNTSSIHTEEKINKAIDENIVLSATNTIDIENLEPATATLQLNTINELPMHNTIATSTIYIPHAEPTLVNDNTNMTVLTLGKLDLQVDNSDEGKWANRLRKSIELFNAAKDLAQNGIEVNLNY